MSALRHMSLHDRKAYALQAAYHGSVRKIAPQAPATELRPLADNVRTFAEQASKGESRLDDFLSASVQRIEKVAQLLWADREIPTSAASVLAAMHLRAAEVRCAQCCNGRICVGKDELDDEIVASEDGGLCILEIKEAFRSATELTQKAYSAYTMLTLPELILETIGLSGPSPEIPGHKIAVNGRTHFEDQDGKLSRIQVRIAPLALGRECLAALPYVLMHEIFCHGFQMAAHPGKRPNKENIPDPVSEGM